VSLLVRTHSSETHSEENLYFLREYPNHYEQTVRKSSGNWKKRDPHCMVTESLVEFCPRNRWKAECVST
jgi:hypothetical protein